MFDTTRACSSRSPELFTTSSTSLMLLLMKGMWASLLLIACNAGTWLKWFELISSCRKVCQLEPLLSLASGVSTTFDGGNFWNSFCWQETRPSFCQFLVTYSMCCWTALGMKCGGPEAVWHDVASSVAENAFAELCRSRCTFCASQAADGNRRRYHRTRRLEAADPTINVIRKCQKCVWMARCKLNLSANGFCEKLNRHLISFGDDDDLVAQSNAIPRTLSLIYVAGAAMIYVVR